MFAAESEGKLPKGTALRWAHHTPDIKKLPERKKKKKEDCCKEANVALAQNVGKNTQQTLSRGLQNPFSRAQQNMQAQMPGSRQGVPGVSGVSGLRSLMSMPTAPGMPKTASLRDMRNVAFGKDPLSRYQSWTNIEHRMPRFLRDHVNNKHVQPHLDKAVNQFGSAALGMLGGLATTGYSLYNHFKNPQQHQEYQAPSRQFDMHAGRTGRPTTTVNQNLGLRRDGRRPDSGIPMD